MKLIHSKKIVALLIVVCAAVSAGSEINFTISTEPSFLFLSLFGLGLIALGRLRRA